MKLLALSPLLLSALSLVPADRFEIACLSEEAVDFGVVIERNDDGAFDVRASSSTGLAFEVLGQRPSLNARVEDGTSDLVNEFVDFSDKGLEIVPVDAPRRLEVDLGPTSFALTHGVDAGQQKLSCRFDRSALISFLGITPVAPPRFPEVTAVGFDIDDTLLFSSPAFTRGFATGGRPAPDDELFWIYTNACDGGCAETTITLNDGTSKTLPANPPRPVKQKAIELVRYHQGLGHEVYAITGRPGFGGDPLRDYLLEQLGIARDHVYFEPDADQPGNPAGKTDRIEALGIDVFYGDSDSDVTDAVKANAKAVRFLRSPKSTNRKAGKLNKYHPGYYGEIIVEGSY